MRYQWTIFEGVQPPGEILPNIDRKILSNMDGSVYVIEYISVLMIGIAYLTNFESFDVDQLEDFFDEWSSFTWGTDPMLNPLPKSLNNREFAMENYSDEGFIELVFAFAEYCGLFQYSSRKDKVPVVGRRLIEKRGNIIPPEDNEIEENE